MRRRTGQIRIPDEAKAGDFDLVCLGSPTWFFTTCMPLRSYLRSDEARAVLSGTPFGASFRLMLQYRRQTTFGTECGGRYIDGIRFTYEGGQIRSLLSLLSYFGKGEMRQRAFGIRIPPTNLKPGFAEQATAFAHTLADLSGYPSIS